MNNKVRLLLFILGYFIIFLVICATYSFTATGLDIITLLINNSLYNTISYVFLIAFFYSIPIFGFPSKYKYILFVAFIVSVFSNLILLASTADLLVYNTFSFLLGQFELKYLLFFNSLVMLFISITLLTISVYKKRLGYIIYNLLFFFYSIVFLLWYIGLVFGYLPQMNLFNPRPLDLIYNITLLPKGNLIFFASLYFIYNTMNKFTNKFTFLRLSNVKKSTKIVVWFFFGYLGIERFLMNSKLYIMNFQILSTIMIISHLLLNNYFYYSFKFNIILVTVLMLFLILKTLLLLYSFSTIISEDKNRSLV